MWDGGNPDCDHQPPPKQARKFTNGRGEGVDDEYAGSNLTSWTYRDATVKDGGCPKGCGARRVDRQLGLEATPDLYVENMVAVFREVRRVLRRDGTCWLNLGDSYAATHHGRGGESKSAKFNDPGDAWRENVVNERREFGSIPDGLKPKDLVGVPWRVAFALQADGWYLRADVIWSKPNPMPESVSDRPTKAHEYLFLLTRSPRYFYDADAIREPAEWAMWGAQTVPKYNGTKSQTGWMEPKTREEREAMRATGRNRRSVWEIATEPYPDAHFATFPQALVEPCVKAGTSERGCCPECGAAWYREVVRTPMVIDRSERTHLKGRTRSSGTMVEPPTSTTLGWRPSCVHANEPVPCTVLDPFMGSGTTALVARRLGRHCVGVELNPKYAPLIADRTKQQSLLA